MAGGTFVTQNKIRPGAYINFKSVPKPISNIGTRGIVSIPMPLKWGKEDSIITIYSTDISDGKLFDKIGYNGSEPDIQLIREALKNSYLLLLYRLDSGGNKATTTIGNLTVTAKYSGTLGNNISVSITEITTKLKQKQTRAKTYSIKTFLGNKIVDEQVTDVIANIKNNNWVEFSGTGDFTASAGKQLANGTDGTISDANYSKYFNLIKNKKFNTIGIVSDEKTVKDNAVAFIKDIRENKGKKVQAVLRDYSSADYEGIISVDQGYKTESEDVDVSGFVAYMAGLTAGSEVNKSNTYHVIPNAIEIINFKEDEEIEEGLKTGKLILSYNSDEKVIIEQDINTLTTFTSEKGEEFSKNRVIRTLDELNNQIKIIWENSFIGKSDNNDSSRNIFKNTIISLANDLQNLNALENFSSDDISISIGQSKDSVVVELQIQPVDSMEKLYMDVLVR